MDNRGKRVTRRVLVCEKLISMNTRIIDYISRLKSMKVQDIGYFAFTIIFFIAVGWCFVMSVRFISKSINQIFTLKETATVASLDIPRYTMIAKKLNIPPDASKEASEFLRTKTNADISSTLTKNEKKLLTIAVLNSTKTPGIAKALAEILNNAGFPSVTTGNETLYYPVTTVFHITGKEMAARLILPIVRKTYPEARTATSTKQTTSDITIIIGGTR